MKEKIAAIKTYGETREFVNGITFDKAAELRSALITMQDSFGLTMRDEMFLQMLNDRVEKFAVHY